MAKVILITSREFKDKKTNNRLPFSKDYVKLFLESNEKTQKGIASYLRNVDEYRKWFEIGDDKKVRMRLSPGDDACDDKVIREINNRINFIINKQLFLENDNNVEKIRNSFLDSIEREIFNPKKDNKNDYFHAGVFELTSAETNDVKMFIAEEYPFLNENKGVFSIEKQMYMDALIGMVKDCVCKEMGLDCVCKDKKDKIDIELQIMSHDEDWGKSGEIPIYNFNAEEVKETMPNLYMIRTAIIHCFQHDIHSKYYKALKDNICDSQKLYDALYGVKENIEKFDKYLESSNSMEDIDVNFNIQYLGDSVCPNPFNLVDYPLSEKT